MLAIKSEKPERKGGITQEFMAMELEVSQSNYGRLEKDDSRLTVPKLIKIAEVLEVKRFLSVWREGYQYHPPQQWR